MKTYVITGNFLIRSLRIFFVSFAFSLVFQANVQASSDSSCQRIISLAPSVTEMIFALDLGPKVVAVTRYCNFPIEAQILPKLGGLFDTNLEAGALLSPDLVVGLVESKNALSGFENLGINTLKISDRSIEDIYSSLNAICKHCDCLEKANKLISDLKNQILPWVKLRENKEIIPVALVVASTVSAGAEELYLSGKDGFYSSIFDNLKANNVFSNSTAAIPSGSFESLITLSPKLIFVVEASGDKFENLRRRILVYLPKSKVVQLNSDYAVIPGPRFAFLMRDIALGLNLVAQEMDLAGEK